MLLPLSAATLRIIGVGVLVVVAGCLSYYSNTTL